jgi:hypothetical protein
MQLSSISFFSRLTILGCTILFLPSLLDAGFYTWRDKSGTLHFTDSYDAIPDAYRRDAQTGEQGREGAAVMIPPDIPQRVVIHFERQDNAILVQAVLNWNLPVFFHLDTGATCTMITREDVIALGLDKGNRPTVKGYIADGSMVELERVVLPSLAVGAAEVQNLEVVVGKMRLLGMDFLREFHVTVDAGSGQLVLERRDGGREREDPSVSEEKSRTRNELENQIGQIDLAIKAKMSYIEELRAHIRESEEQKAKVQSVLHDARQRTRFEGSDISFDASTGRRIEKYEEAIAGLDRRIEMRQNEIAILQKQVEQLQGKMDYYESLIMKL